MAENIEKKDIGFANVEYSLSALPIIPFLKLQGFASEGVSWEENEPVSVKLGADGLAAKNSKPVLYVGTFSLLPNSPSRKALDSLIAMTTVKYGKRLVDYDIILTEKNYTTSETRIYSGAGSITTAQAGNNANLDEGQGNKNYKMTFADMTPMPLN